MNQVTHTTDYTNCGAEPSLEDVFHDTIIQVMMARDGVDESTLLPLLRKAHARMSKAAEDARTHAA